MIHRLGLLALVAAFTFIGGCKPATESTTAAAPAPVANVPLTPVEHVAWLSRRLPPETIGYFRLPLIWDLLSQPRADALNNVKASAVHQEQLASIRQGLSDNLWSELPQPAVAPVRLLLNRLTSPLEVAATLPPDGSPVPNFLIGASLELQQDQTFPELLDELLALHPQLRRLSPEDADGVSTILAGPLPVYVHYDAPEQRLRMFTGTSATLSYFTDLLDAEPSANPVADWESPRDMAGRGISLWVDIERWWPLLAPLAPPEAQPVLAALAVDQMKSLRVVNVAKDGHGQLRMDLEMPRVGFRQLLPNPAAPIEINTVGAPELLVRLAIPSEAEFSEALEFIRSLVPDSEAFDKGLSEAREWVRKSFGHDPSLILKALGPQHVSVWDGTGSWSATALGDAAARDEMMAAWAKVSEREVDVRQINGAAYHYVPLSSDMYYQLESVDPSEGTEAVAKAFEILGRVSSHIFWTDQGDQMIMAAVPQILVDRDEFEPSFEVGPWLKQVVGVDPDSSILLIAARSDKGARTVYHVYLQLLLALADLADVRIDPFALPTWTDARQGPPGGVAFGIDASESAVSGHITYQSSFLEAMGGTQVIIAGYVAGILAAISIPAYQDYQLRSEVSVVLASMGPARVSVGEALAAGGELPSALDEALLEAPAMGVTLSYDSETGALTATFDETATGALAETSLYLVPVIEGDQILNWECYSETMADKLLPVSCQP